MYRHPDHIWFIWVLAGWGIGVASHDLALLLQRTGRREAIFTDKRKRGFFIHLFVYLAVNALLIVVNLLYTPDYYWFLFPLVGWGLMLAAHAYATFYRRRGGARSARTGAKT
jgi:2TM domain